MPRLSAVAARPAQEALVHDHLPLVQYAVSEIAGRIPRHVHRDDLVSAGLLGLTQAARTFDPDRGVTFARHARTRVRGAVLDELRERDWASRSVRSSARELESVRAELSNRLGRAPSDFEVSASLGVSKEEVARLSEDVHRATVLDYDSLFLEGGPADALAADEPGPPEAMVERERQAYLHDAVLALPDRLRQVVLAYFYEERTLLDIAGELGVTESRVSQLRSEALALLREGMHATHDAVSSPAASGATEAKGVEGRTARRKAAYYAAIASASTYRERLDDAPEPLPVKAGRLHRRST